MKTRQDLERAIYESIAPEFRDDFDVTGVADELVAEVELYVSDEFGAHWTEDYARNKYDTVLRLTGFLKSPDAILDDTEYYAILENHDLTFPGNMIGKDRTKESKS